MPVHHPVTAAPDRELDSLIHHVALADWLVLAIVLFHQLASSTDAAPIWLAAVAFGTFNTLLRIPRLPLLSTFGIERRLELESWAMVAFIGFAVWRSGADASPLQSLYLLPVVLAGLVLSASRLVPVIVAIGATCIAAIVADPDVEPRSIAFAGRALLAVAPLAIVAWLTSELGAALSSARRRAAALAAGDALTGLVGRRAFIDALQEELAMAAQRGQPTSLLVLDLAGTGRINELYGQEAGNAALRMVADVLRRVLRQTDRAGRLGGDEFGVLLSGADAAAAQVAVQRIRHALNATTLDVGARHLRCTASIGAAAVPRDARDATTLISAAERRLKNDRELRASAALAATSG